MRFSLRTFFFACLLVSSIVGISLRHGAWVRDRRITLEEADKAATELVKNALTRDLQLALTNLHSTPDGRRLSQRWDDTLHGYSVAVHAADKSLLAEFNLGTTKARGVRFGGLLSLSDPVDAVFGDSDTIYHGTWKSSGPYAEQFVAMKDCTVYRRRYPEYWWGHLFRVEVLAAILSGGALLVTIVTHLRRQTGN